MPKKIKICGCLTELESVKKLDVLRDNVVYHCSAELQILTLVFFKYLEISESAGFFSSLQVIEDKLCALKYFESVLKVLSCKLVSKKISSQRP